MIEPFTKSFGIYHWDTFDNETILIGEADTLAEARSFVKDRYAGQIGPKGADRVDIVNRDGDIIEQVKVGCSSQRISVSKDEFIQRLVASGKDATKSESMATIAQALGSYVEIGEEIVGIIDDQ